MVSREYSLERGPLSVEWRWWRQWSAVTSPDDAKVNVHGVQVVMCIGNATACKPRCCMSKRLPVYRPSWCVWFPAPVTFKWIGIGKPLNEITDVAIPIWAGRRFLVCKYVITRHVVKFVSGKLNLNDWSWSLVLCLIWSSTNLLISHRYIIQFAPRLVSSKCMFSQVYKVAGRHAGCNKGRCPSTLRDVIRYDSTDITILSPDSGLRYDATGSDPGWFSDNPTVV